MRPPPARSAPPRRERCRAARRPPAPGPIPPRASARPGAAARAGRSRRSRPTRPRGCADRAAHRDPPTGRRSARCGRAAPFPVPCHGASCAQPWLMTVRRRSIGQGKASALSPAASDPSPPWLSSMQKEGGGRVRCVPSRLSVPDSRPNGGEGSSQEVSPSTYALSSAWRRSARMSSSCSIPIDRRT